MTEPLQPTTRPWNKLSAESAEIDIEEFEFLLSAGESMTRRAAQGTAAGSAMPLRNTNRGG